MMIWKPATGLLVSFLCILSFPALPVGSEKRNYDDDDDDDDDDDVVDNDGDGGDEDENDDKGTWFVSPFFQPFHALWCFSKLGWSKIH